MAFAETKTNEPLQLARDIAPVLRAEADQGEKDRRLTPAAVDALMQTGMYRLFRPKSLGGWDLDPVAGLEVVDPEILSSAIETLGEYAQIERTRRLQSVHHPSDR